MAAKQRAEMNSSKSVAEIFNLHKTTTQTIIINKAFKKGNVFQNQSKTNNIKHISANVMYKLSRVHTVSPYPVSCRKQDAQSAHCNQHKSTNITLANSA